ncbi:hypothetical protein [Acetobacterium woodii]|uniref:BioF2-like acetyltransferase domain-containing protein n=1 Tax=Acetobacterium woodii (strain ATCC 29683 / DSM 1030 / JCM 2381 / KCTC 1655 / WB1) TaxID=931626 RepID=H6LBB9_ACEWD|nr:hypothetical protein [Acetobacterium woodii]AFA48874.1 hypothetical protein Awo_c20980 [Acetobacterium woodii DSM 1030]
MIETIFFDIEKKKISDNINNVFEINDFIKPIFYDTAEFQLYHKKFAEKVYQIVFVKENKCLGYCYVGIKEKIIKAPYSAPFAMMYLSEKYRVIDVCELIESFKICLSLFHCNKIEITLPPEIYSEELINTEFAAFSSKGFKVKEICINNYFNLTKFINKEDYLSNLGKMARRNNKVAVKNNLEFAEISIKDYKLAYEVIKFNHEEQGYPVKISEEQMEDLINMNALTCRCFGIRKDNMLIAAAIIFDVTDEISQIIYWGDILAYRKMSPMTLLATEIINYYKKLKKKYIDIGPSSENGIINTGLADFKKNIGADNDVKITFQFES